MTSRSDVTAQPTPATRRVAARSAGASQAATVVLAIDPGPVQSAWLLYSPVLPFPVRQFCIEPNEEALRKFRARGQWGGYPDVVVIEQIEPRYGLSPGWETLDTARWVGRFEEAAQPTPVVRLNRSEVLRHLGVVTRAKKGEPKTSADAGVRAALIDRFGGSAAIGLKRSPGPLYGISKDVWSALALAVTYTERETR